MQVVTETGEKAAKATASPTRSECSLIRSISDTVVDRAFARSANPSLVAMFVTANPPEWVARLVRRWSDSMAPIRAELGVYHPTEAHVHLFITWGARRDPVVEVRSSTEVSKVAVSVMIDRNEYRSRPDLACALDRAIEQAIVAQRLGVKT